MNSFTGDTLVSTPDGDKPIEDIEVGDIVLAYNEETGEIGEYPVTHVWSHEGDESLVTLSIDGEIIIATAGHPFYTADGEWIAAGDLQIGAEVYSADGTHGTLDALVITDGTAWVYNLTVDEAHTYFVGDGQWLVHNCGGPDGDGKKEFPNPGEIPQGALGEGRALASSLPITKKKYGKIQNPLSGLYEFRDKLTGKWYVGQASDLRARLQSHFDAGRFDNWDDVVVTFVSARTRTLDFIEQIRIDQIASLVGGYKNTINKVNPTIPKGALLWWNQGEWMKIVNYPKWLTPPKNFYHD